MSTCLVALCTLLCAACIQLPVTADPAPRAPAPVPSASSPSAIADGVLREVNRARRSAGVPELRSHAALERTAAEHAAELARRRTLDHTSTTPGRRTLTDRIEAAGVAWSAAAENLASVPARAGDVPGQTVQLWLGSPGHRRNLLQRTYTHSGVGVAHAGGYWYVTQVYVLPRSRR